ncbi:izumo sperm-egg fusion protein 1 isoform X2 [Gadus morhua]|uniref:izumo sperm-egg fusion protein 1 isoform X2 n=1 Tax=Gadus morhua TaxID=8049 RepID=UPI0011B8141B|nr:izumo sperm-egg fusion protein 1 isoform X2 [Gadus morhua]
MQTFMRPQLLVVSLLALCRMPAGRACLQCDRKTRLLHEDFLLSAASVEKQIALTMIRDHAYVTYRQTSQAHRGVSDPTTFYRVSTEYHSEFNRIKKTLQPGSGTIDAIQIMEKGRKILEKHLVIFIREGLCPNKCDQLDCGEHHLEAEEGDQAVLNCFLPWHSLIQGTPEYHFTWAPGPPGSTQLEESDFQTLVVTEEPSVVLNQLHAKEQGTYRCSLQDRKATVFSTVTFFLTVTALPTQTPIQLITLPTLPPRYTSSTLPLTRYQLLSIIATVTALSLVASIGLTVALGLTMKRKMKELRARRMVSVY